MTRNPLLLAVVFGCLLGSAMATGSAAASPPVASSAAGPLCVAGNPQSFVNAVQLLNTNFTPTGAAVPPGVPVTWQPPFSTDLANAFSHSPPAFQQRLCSLSGIYIDSYGCTNNDPAKCVAPTGKAVFTASWGYRQLSDGVPGGTYIAISAGLWPNGAPAMPLHVYETEVAAGFPGFRQSVVQPATPDDSSMTVLAALAHEMGHVRFIQTVKTSGTYDFTPLTNNCTPDFFKWWAYNHANSPKKHPHMQPFHGWRGFAERLNDAGQQLDHTVAPFLTQLDNPPAGSHPLWDLYQPSQPWASLFAAQTPDEDFVETYVMAVLTGYANTPNGPTFAGPLTSLPIAIPGAPSLVDVPHDLIARMKQPLTEKMACIAY